MKLQFHMAAVIENHQGMLLSLLNTTYNKRLLSSKEERKIIDCTGRHSIGIIQMKSPTLFLTLQRRPSLAPSHRIINEGLEIIR